MHVYADNAATTAMSQVAIDAMLPYFNKVYGNPSSLHSIGQEAKEALDAARATMAACLGCEPREIIFTSGGSEADNQAILSAARFGARKGKKHIIVNIGINAKSSRFVYHLPADLREGGTLKNGAFVKRLESFKYIISGNTCCSLLFQYVTYCTLI